MSPCICISLSICIEKYGGERRFQYPTPLHRTVAIHTPDATQLTPRVTVAKEFLEVAQWLSKNGIDDEIRERS